MTDHPPPPGAPYPHAASEPPPPPQQSPSHQPPPQQPPPPSPPPQQPPLPQPPSQQPANPTPPRRTRALIATAVVVGVLAVAVAVLTTLLVVGGDDETATTSTIPGTLPTTSQPGGTTGGTTADGGTTGGVDGASPTSVQEIEQILGQSAAGRTEVVDVVTGVLGCTLPLDEASGRMAAVTSNRRAVLAQVDALGATGSAALDRAVDLLGQAIVSSLEANANYSAWIDWLGATQSTAYTSGCPPSGEAPTDGDYDAAVAASGRATAAKAEFVAVFNPIAGALGLRTWSGDEI